MYILFALSLFKINKEKTEQIPSIKSNIFITLTPGFTSFVFCVEKCVAQNGVQFFEEVEMDLVDLFCNFLSPQEKLDWPVKRFCLMTP